MALRPLRTATITFGLVNIPVRVYTATKSEDVHFNLLHVPCGTRVSRKWWCAQHEELLTPDQMIRGYAVGKNQYVTLSDEEMAALETEENRSLDITEFVDLEDIDPVFYEKAYYLGPVPGGAKTYRLLAQAMKKQNKVAIARWVMGHREHLVVLRPFEDGLILHTMYYADEVRDFSALDIEESEPREKEVALAELLISELTETEFDPLAYKDEYRERLMDRIRSKAEGGGLIVSESRDDAKAAEVVDIMEALRRSLEGGAPAKRAPAKRAPARTAKKTTVKKRKVS